MTRIRVGLFFAMLAISSAPALATSITVGAGGSGNVFPFGCGAACFPYVGEYQQVYASTAFSGPIMIRQVAFDTTSQIGAASLTDTFTLSLGTTGATPAAPGATYAGNRRPDFTTVFSGVVNLPSVGGAGFDFIINLTTPFLYNPANGNLLLDVNIGSNVIVGASGVSFVFGTSPDTGRLYNSGGSGPVAPDANNGLITQFSDVSPTAVPEPASLTLLASGMALSAWRRRSRRQGR